MSFLDILLLIISSFLIGVSYVIVLFPLEHWGAFTIVFLRMLIVSILGFYSIYKLRKDLKKLEWVKICAVGLLNVVGFQSLIIVAMNMGLDAATSVIVKQMHVPITCILGYLFLGEQMSFKNVLGILISMIGIVTIFGNPSFTNNVPIIIGVLAAFCYASANLISKKVHYISKINLIIISAMVVLPIEILLAYFYDGLSFDYLAAAPISAWMSVAYLSVLVTLVATTLLFEMIKKHSVQVVSSFSLLSPVFGMIAAKIILNDPLSNRLIFGAIVALIGVFIIVIDFKKMFKNNIV